MKIFEFCVIEGTCYKVEISFENDSLICELFVFFCIHFTRQVSGMQHYLKKSKLKKYTIIKIKS